jgi:hypothetical protein
MEFPRKGETPSEPATRRAVVDAATGRVNRPGHSSAYRRSDDPDRTGPAAKPAAGSGGDLCDFGRRDGVVSWRLRGPADPPPARLV